jgi:hypothetical protein
MDYAQELERILRSSPLIWGMLEKAPSFGLSSYYFGAGAISQTVWNSLYHCDPLHGIADVDFVYFDPDLSYEKEDHYIKLIQAAFKDSPLAIDVKNEARVHLWYAKHFGYSISPYHTLEEAVDSWPTTVTTIGVRLEQNHLQIYARFGLEDLFKGVIRPNKVAVKKEVYLAKCAKWKSKWPELETLPWDD